MQTVTYQRPWLYPKQETAFFTPTDNNGRPARYSLIEASTKAGKTVGCIAWLYEQAFVSGGRGKNYWWVAPVYGQAEIAFRRMQLGLPQSQFSSNKRDMTITLPNGATLWFKSADNPDSLYGEDVYAAVVDEASRCKQDAWFALRSTLTATRGPVRFIGNVKGRRNWFYQMCRKAEGGEAGMAYYKITADDAVAAGVLVAEEIEDAQHSSGMPEAVFRELYYAEPSDDAGNPFGIKHIAACVKPLSKLPPVNWGWDLAKKHDWTVGVALDKNGDICRFERFQQPWPETIETIKRETGMLPALVDSTGVGDPVIDMLQKMGSNFEGYLFTMPSKQKLMEGLAVSIQQGTTSVLEGVHRMEMESFEYVYTRTGVRYEAPEGFHDDTVCAHALANIGKLRGPDLSVWEKLVQ